jgi:CheY-like chemotaxis protein
MAATKKLLVAEDDRDVKWIYDYMLKAEGYSVFNAYDGAAAVLVYKEHRPDLVLMDIQMPVMTGDEAIRQILGYDPGARIVAVTAYNHSEETLGVPVLRKGFRKTELLEIIQNNLEK